ncbi:MAG: 4-hydroxy-tetrahydrodipicolinate reductase [Planctomycetia bacterium]
MDTLRIAVHGACGRMGQRVVEGVHRDPALTVAAAWDSASSPHLGRDVGELCGLGPIGVRVAPVDPTSLEPIDAVIDFSVPEASLAMAEYCAGRQIPLVVATTGFTAEQREKLVEFHHTTPLLVAANLSLVVNVLMKLAREAGAALKGKDFDVEIVERHHRFKADAPSGTALRFAEILEQEMELTERVYGREGLTGERPRSQIGLHAVRVGDNVGEHAIIFSTLGETMELVHRSHGRESYVRGALEAAKFLTTRKAGLYTMADVLGL